MSGVLEKPLIRALAVLLASLFPSVLIAVRFLVNECAFKNLTKYYGRLSIRSTDKPPIGWVHMDARIYRFLVHRSRGAATTRVSRDAQFEILHDTCVLRHLVVQTYIYVRYF